jgi:hypothetical protein
VSLCFSICVNVVKEYQLGKTSGDVMKRQLFVLKLYVVGHRLSGEMAVIVRITTGKI